MRKKAKRTITKVFAVALVITGALTAVNASAADVPTKVSGIADLRKGNPAQPGLQAKKGSVESSDALITFNTKIPAGDTVIVNLKDSKGNIVGTGNARFTNLSAGTSKRVGYHPGSGRNGYIYTPTFKLDAGSASTKLSVNYTFKA